VRTVKAACSELVELLKAAGYVAATDPEALHAAPGCVWVQPRQILDPTLGGGATLVAWLYLIVANTETDRAMELLDDALGGLLELGLPLSESDDSIDLTAAVALPSAPSQPLPAYRLAVDLDL
jgi:hypothetical protein